MLILVVFILLIFLFLLPFLPGIAELVRKQDTDPLFISMSYVKDPRYFGKSFRRLIRHASEGLSAGPEIHDVLLSKKEKLQVVELGNIPDGAEINYLLYVKGSLSSGDRVRLIKEVYVTGDTSIGSNNVIRALAVDGNVRVGEGSQFERWLDASGAIDISKGCNLGISMSSSRTLCLAPNCQFRRLYGQPIVTSNNAITRRTVLERSVPRALLLPRQQSFIRRNEGVIEAHSIINSNTVFSQDVQIGCGCIFRADIKSYGKLVLEEDVRVDGNVFADGDILIGRGANIKGHIFSQGAVHICEQTVTSYPGAVKSIIAKKSIRIEQNVTIYGYVVTEGDGRIL